MVCPIIVGFQGLEPDWSWLKRVNPAGVILFTRNLESVEHLLDLTARLHREQPGCVVAIDEEGGRVHRLRPLLGEFPGPAVWRDGADARHHGQVMGAMLAALGIDLNFAPVVDLDYGRTGNALDQRYLGKVVDQVVEKAAGYLAGLRSSGVEGCLKHFPGLGSTLPDSHYALPELCLDEAAWQAGEGRIYSDLAGRGLNDVPLMLAHVQVPFWGGEISSLSARAVQAARALGHKGLLLTDDLEMKALPQGDLPGLGLAALRAGLDLLIVCHEADRIEAIADRLKSAADVANHSEKLGTFQTRLAALRARAPGSDLTAAQQSWQRLLAQAPSNEGLFPTHEFLT